MATIYQITTEGDEEGRSTRTVGYATGNVDDIKAYYGRHAMYSLRVQEIEVMHVTPETIAKRTELERKKRTLERRIERLTTELEKIGEA